MYSKYFKRSLDLVCSIIGFVLLSPIFVIIFLILLYVNKGKPFFYQRRPGKNERIFEIMKFKTMTDTTDKDGILLPDEKRLTRLGDFMRRTSLDEIPQLLNVIKGDMSLVGPRPLRVRYLPFYTEEERIRHTVRPGITGLAQVSGRNSLNWDEKLALDVKYVEKITFAKDFIILLKTVKKVFITSNKEIIVDPEMDALDTYRLRKSRT
jgi:lipopolysaccharide/colanic/teichoic acid biosynthesis glycosyltransferase